MYLQPVKVKVKVMAMAMAKLTAHAPPLPATNVGVVGAQRWWLQSFVWREDDRCDSRNGHAFRGSKPHHLAKVISIYITYVTASMKLD